jgi:hypothetical protein
VGWKENFNMSFMMPVPAQLEAVAYTEKIAEALSGDLYLGGHSKGGNLAVYAAVKCDPKIKSRILGVYNNDGPGFDALFIEGADYQSMRGKIRTIVPHSSVVGMLLEHEDHYEVVKSNATAIFQHDALSWEVLGSQFINLDTVTQESRLIDQTLKTWMNGLSVEEREHIVDALYETLAQTNYKTITELTSDKVKLVKAWGTLDPKVKSMILKMIGILFHESRNLRKK